MLKRILPNNYIRMYDQKETKKLLKKKVDDIRVKMLVERAIFYGYKPFNFKKFCLKAGKVAIGPICALSIFAVLIFSTYAGASLTLGKDNANQKKFVLNEFNAINAKTKNEMVIGSADANGLIYEIKDRVTLQGVDKNSTYIKDKTNLTNIENINGDELLEVHDGYVYLENKKTDVVYEGISKEKMPVGVNVSYYLDGKKVSPEKIAGKSGHVTIRFDYTNNTLNSEYIPYVAMSAVILDAEKFTNIKTNANALSIGNNILAYGGTIPGFREFVSKNGHGSINIQVDDFVQIEADTTNFAIDSTFTVFSNGFSKSIKEETLNQIDSVEEISAINIPTDQITTYVSELLVEANIFADLMSKLETDSQELVGTSKNALTNAVNLKNGAKNLSNGIRALANNATNLANGAGQVVEDANELEEDSNGYKTDLDNYANGVKNLNDGISELNSKLTFMPGLSSTIKEIAKFLDDVESFAAIISSYSTTISKAIENSREADDEETASKLEELFSELSPDGFFMTNMHSIVTRIADMLYDIAADIDELYDAAVDIGKNSSDLANTSDDLTKAYDELSTGVSKLGDGISNMDKSIVGLSGDSEDSAIDAEGIATESKNMNDAVNKLDSGINNLNKGIKNANKDFAKFRNGILNIRSIKVGGNSYTQPDNLRYLLNCIKQMKQSDEKYFPFSGADASVSGTTSYVIKTDGIQ